MANKNVQAQEATACRVQKVLESLLRAANLTGDIVVFGSFSNGFKTGGSDLDVVLVTKQKSQSDAVTTLNKVAGLAPKYNFTNITKIFQAKVPILKFTDAADGMEIDFCINNLLGIRNSLLLQAYCRLDSRIPQLGRMIKAWAKGHEIVGAADGCLNSYAYMLLVIYYLQVGCNPPVAVNLQTVGPSEPHKVMDYKWGAEGGDAWDTQFLSDVSHLPHSKNAESLDSLLKGFFHFYANLFDWKKDAVCMRLAPEKHVPKVSLLCFAQSMNSEPDQWCCEDPFDLKHNLGGKCTLSGKKRIQDEMVNALRHLQKGDIEAVVNPKPKSPYFYLKCRVSGAVTPQAMLEEFEAYNIKTLYFPKATDSKVRFQQAFLEFSTNEARRKAHTKNETYVADCQLQMHYTSQSALTDTLTTTQYSQYDMASYKMQRHILETGTDARRPNPTAAPFFPGVQYGMPNQGGLGRHWDGYVDENLRTEEMDNQNAHMMERQPMREMMDRDLMDLDPRRAAAMMDHRREMMEMRGPAAMMHDRREFMEMMAGKGGNQPPPRRDRELMDAMMSKGRRDMNMMDPLRPGILERRGKGLQSPPMTHDRMQALQDRWGVNAPGNEAFRFQSMDWTRQLQQQKNPNQPSVGSTATAMQQKGKMDSTGGLGAFQSMSPVLATGRPVGDGSWNPQMGAQPPVQPTQAVLKKEQVQAALTASRKEEKRTPSHSPRVHPNYDLTTFILELKIPESTQWKEVPLTAVTDLEVKAGQEIKGRIFPPNLIESLRNFYGSFKNEEYEKWKRQRTAGAH
eukprot:GEMP01005360.1.p1 GENE.GEMP01005360.1~~GEMP01005360.1.p1  ORF type:complete len:792 (-),score=155.40 GEMP01005360.1:1588-3963(-)